MKIIGFSLVILLSHFSLAPALANGGPEPVGCWKSLNPNVVDGEFVVGLNATKLNSLELATFLDDAVKADLKLVRIHAYDMQAPGEDSIMVRLQAKARVRSEASKKQINRSLQKLISRTNGVEFVECSRDDVRPLPSVRAGN